MASPPILFSLPDMLRKGELLPHFQKMNHDWSMPILIRLTAFASGFKSGNMTNIYGKYIGDSGDFYPQ